MLMMFLVINITKKTEYKYMDTKLEIQYTLNIKEILGPYRNITGIIICPQIQY